MVKKLSDTSEVCMTSKKSAASTNGPAYWGQEKYSGSASDNRWPGCGTVPVLEIPDDGFTFRFKTDGSNV